MARLALLKLNDDELETFTHQLADILEHANDMAALDLDGVETTTHPYPLKNVMRSDEVGALTSVDAVMAQAPACEANQFRVPPVLGEES